MRCGFEKIDPPEIGGTLPHDAYIEALHSIAVSLKRIADAQEKVAGRVKSSAR